MKRRILCVSAVVITLAILAAMAMAYFTTAAKTENAVTASNVRLALHDASGTEDQIVQIMPGDTVKRPLSVKNLGNEPIYLRVRLDVSVSDKTLAADGCLAMDTDASAWTYRDGYYYYERALESGGQTPPLFTHVSVDGSKVDSSYSAETFTLTTHAFGVQSAHNGDSALAAAGWPEA
ncbi:hypothetical protein [Gordonibacter sp.]|uniref:hypothetical protein n=1 Tax=Gordonibacter sp. TaxID=1968902 RepID=UPI0025C00103|nr:hypothetical protein [Gordonibacter sp.]